MQHPAVQPISFLLSQMLSSDSPGTLALSLPKSPSFLVTLQALSLSLSCQSHQTSHTIKLQISHVARLQPTLTCSSVVVTYFLTLITTARNPIARCRQNLSRSNGSQVFQPCNDLWYLPKICSRISQICLCISVSNSLRWSRNIAMMSRWFAFRRTSSSNGKSHSMRTIRVCTSLKTLVTLSKPIIHSM